MKLIINHSYTSLNEYIKKERSNKYAASQIKKKESQISEWETMYKHHRLTYPLKLTFTWHLKNAKRDPDNIAFAKKFVLDGFVKSGFFVNDGQKQINELADKFVVDGEEYVEIEILEN